MRLSTRVILVTAALLAVIIVGMVIVTLFQLPWLWPAEKWPDFWVAVVSGVIIAATIGALATFFVERILKDIEEQRSKKQFQVECEKEWDEFEQRLYYRLLEELSLSHNIDYAAMATPHFAKVIASLLETVPLSRWKRGLNSPSLLFRNIEYFARYYSTFKTQANKIAQQLRSTIDQYNRNKGTNGHTQDTNISEDAQRAFCLRLLMEDYKLNEEHDAELAGAKNSPVKVTVIEETFKTWKDKKIKEAAADMLWQLRLSDSTLSDLLDLYSFVREKIADFDIHSYGNARQELIKHTEEIWNTASEEETHKSINRTIERTDEILQKAKESGSITEIDRLIIENNMAYLDVIRKF